MSLTIACGSLLAASVTVALPVTGSAQELGDAELGVGPVYARAFGGAGVGLDLDLRWIVPFRLADLEHGVGFRLWFASSDIASGNAFGDRRRMVGLGFDWQARFHFLGGRLRPYVAVPVQLLQSSIPDHITVQDLSGPPSEKPLEDRVGTKTALALGLGVGSQLRLARALGVTAGVTVLRQRLHEGNRSPVVLMSVRLTYGVAGSVEM